MKYIPLLFIGLIIISCSSLDPIHLRSDLQKSMISGKVITEEGLPLEGVTVKINEFQETMTDINGRFLFNYIRYGKHTITTEKDDYLPGEYKFIYNFRNRRIPFAKIKMLSLNHLVDEGFEYLKENKYDKTLAIIEQLDVINSNEEIVLYLKAMYFYLLEKYDDAIALLEHLKVRDRKNLYYQLTLIDIYEKLKMYKEMADLSFYLGKNNPREYSDYIDMAKKIYKEKLGKIIKEDDIKNILIDQIRKDKIKAKEKIKVKIKEEKLEVPEVAEKKEEPVKMEKVEIKEEEKKIKDTEKEIEKEAKKEEEKKVQEEMEVKEEKVEEEVDKVEKVETKPEEKPKVKKKKKSSIPQRSYYQMYIEQKRKEAADKKREEEKKENNE